MDLNSPFSMGTTIVGVSYNGGVVLGASDDARTTGMYVRSSDNNITQLTDNVYLCSSGSAAETQSIADHVRCILHEETIKLGQPATVKVVANLVRSISYHNKDTLRADMIVGGWDKYDGGKIYEITMGGTQIDEQPFAIGGSSSSSSYLSGFFEQTWKDQAQGMMMCEEQAKQMVIRAISLAIDRDGGAVRTVIINSEGVTRKLYQADHDSLRRHQELEPKNSLLDILSSTNKL